MVVSVDVGVMGCRSSEWVHVHVCMAADVFFGKRYQQGYSWVCVCDVLLAILN